MLKHSNIKYCKHRDLYKPLFATRSTTIIDLSENSAQPDNCDSTCHQRDHHRGRRIELLHQCQLRRRVGSLANFFIVHANSTIVSYNFHRFINLFMTKLPPSSLSSCPNSILIPAGEPPWWRWTPGPMMWGPSSTRCWSPWTPPTGYKYIQPEYSMILDSLDTKKCLQYPWSLHFIGSLTNCFMVTPGANFQDSCTPSTVYCQYFIELFCIRLQISTRNLQSCINSLTPCLLHILQVTMEEAGAGHEVHQHQQAERGQQQAPQPGGLWLMISMKDQG